MQSCKRPNMDMKCDEEEQQKKKLFSGPFSVACGQEHIKQWSCHFEHDFHSRTLFFPFVKNFVRLVTNFVGEHFLFYLENILFVLEQILFANTFCSIWSIFCSCFYANNNNKNNKASFRTFEQSSWSKTWSFATISYSIFAQPEVKI